MLVAIATVWVGAHSVAIVSERREAVVMAALGWTVSVGMMKDLRPP